MFKQFWTGLILVLLLAVSATIVFADASDLDGEYPWKHHAAPYDYKFGNMIDSHQQSFVDKTGNQLKGFIYIHNTNDDYAPGIPTADKAHCKNQPCMVGWLIKGVKVSATLMKKGPRIWLVDPNDLPKEKGYTHFHWICEKGVTGCPHSAHDLVVGQAYSGFLMKRIAPAPFFWLGGPGTGGGGPGGSGGGGGCGGGTHDDGGCSDGSHDDGGCSGGGTDTTHTTEGGCTDTTHDDGGCTDGTHDDGGCSDGSHDDGGCSGGGGSGGSHGGGAGRLVTIGVDSHSNIITDPGQLGGHGGCHED